MKIKEANKNDIRTLSNLIHNSFLDVAKKFGLTKDNCPTHPSNCTDNWIQTDLLAGKRYFILEANYHVGCIAFERANENLYYIERLAVLPQERNKGYGKILVHYIIEKVRDLSGNKISIGIIDKHSVLKNWYKEIGFKITKSKQHTKLPFTVTFMEYKL
ncbi:MAG TPA: GNAT family N-acetyltransferase [Victivallales bacterium]|nr:GNAT family N-acetyltransferase [Victivallales bacterium]